MMSPAKKNLSVSTVSQAEQLPSTFIKMEQKEKKNTHQACSTDGPNLIDSPSSSHMSHLYRDSPVWPTDWGALDHGSESSDWLSQSVASSTSWSDELEGDLTRSLQQQMKLVENTLYRDGNSQLSTTSSLRDECRLWQQSFPHLRVLGEAVKPSVGCQTKSRHEEIEEEIDEIIAAHGDYDKEFTNKAVVRKQNLVETNEVYKEKIKKAVIDQIFSRIWPEVLKRIEPALKRAAKTQEDVLQVSPQFTKCNNSCDDELTSGFNSLSLVEDFSLNSSLRTRSGRKSALSARKDYTAMVPIRPVVIECSIPVPSALSVRVSSALRRSPARLSQPSLSVKLPSPERLLSPMVLQNQVRTTVKSAGGRKVKVHERRQDVKTRPQYDAKTGRMICRDESRSGLRRNLKTSPPVPWSRHVTLPPIEACEVTSNKMELNSKRSNSGLFKGGRLNSGSRPNTSLTAKNQVVLSPLECLQVQQPSATNARLWTAELHYNNNCEKYTIKSTDQRQRWRNRSNVIRK